MQNNILNIAKLQKLIQYEFKDESLLQLAMTHPSLGRVNYEVLEFLGDSVLNFIITTEIIKKFSLNSHEGILSKIKSYLISKEFLVQIANELNLFEFLQISYGESITNGQKKDNALENATEALIGAIYLDSSIEKAREFVLHFWGKYIDIKNLDLEIAGKSFDPKSKLQELIYKQYKKYPIYTLVNVQINKFEHIFEVELYIEDMNLKIKAIGKNKKDAEKHAAKEGLEYLKKINFYQI
ncbi:MAG: ribonuclease III [Rickettsiales bacterium]